MIRGINTKPILNHCQFWPNKGQDRKRWFSVSWKPQPAPLQSIQCQWWYRKEVTFNYSGHLVCYSLRNLERKK